MMELNTHCTEIKYFYLELLALYLILTSLSLELFWDKGLSKHVFDHKQVTNKICSKIHMPCTLLHQHIINLRQQFYKHKLDVKTLERIKELGLKKFRGSRGGRNKDRAWSSNKGAHQYLLQTLPKCNITKWNHTPIRMLLINIQSIKSKIDTLLHHINLNDIDICFITETGIHTDQDLQILEANISGLGYKIIDKHRENQSGGDVACIYKGHLDIRTCTKDNAYTSFECLTIKHMAKSKLHWIFTIY